MNIFRSANPRSQVNPEIFPFPHRPTTRQTSRGVFIGSNIGLGRSTRDNRTVPRDEIGSGFNVTGSAFQQRFASSSNHLPTRAAQLRPATQENRTRHLPSLGSPQAQKESLLPSLTTTGSGEPKESLILPAIKTSSKDLEEQSPGVSSNHSSKGLPPLSDKDLESIVPYDESNSSRNSRSSLLSEVSSSDSYHESRKSSEGSSEGLAQVMPHPEDSDERDSRSSISSDEKRGISIGVGNFSEENSSRKNSKESEGSSKTRSYPEVSSGGSSRKSSSPTAALELSADANNTDVRRDSSGEEREMLVRSFENGRIPRSRNVVPGIPKQILIEQQKDKEILQEEFDALSTEFENFSRDFDSVRADRADAIEDLLVDFHTQVMNRITDVDNLLDNGRVIIRNYKKYDTIADEFEKQLDQHGDELCGQLYPAMEKMIPQMSRLDLLLKKTPATQKEWRKVNMNLMSDAVSLSSFSKTPRGSAYAQKMKHFISASASESQWGHFIKEFQNFHQLHKEYYLRNG